MFFYRVTTGHNGRNIFPSAECGTTVSILPIAVIALFAAVNETVAAHSFFADAGAIHGTEGSRTAGNPQLTLLACFEDAVETFGRTGRAGRPDGTGTDAVRGTPLAGGAGVAHLTLFAGFQNAVGAHTV